MKPSALAVLSLLRDRGHTGVTPGDALGIIGVYRLAARVNDLRRDGYDIHTEMIRAGHARIAKYTLRERPVQLALLDSPDGAADSFPRGSVQVAERRPLAGPGVG